MRAKSSSVVPKRSLPVGNGIPLRGERRLCGPSGHLLNIARSRGLDGILAPIGIKTVVFGFPVIWNSFYFRELLGRRGFWALDEGGKAWFSASAVSSDAPAPAASAFGSGVPGSPGDRVCIVCLLWHARSPRYSRGYSEATRRFTGSYLWTSARFVPVVPNPSFAVNRFIGTRVLRPLLPDSTIGKHHQEYRFGLSFWILLTKPGELSRALAPTATQICLF